MPNNAQEDINKLTNKERIRYLDLSNRELAGEMNLKDFKNLKSINSSNNKFTDLNFLNSLENKDKIEKINCWGNEISEIDLAEILKNFPNLKWLNLENNPLSAKNLNKLTSEQFGKLVEGIKNKQIRINSYKGTVLMDLLEYTQQLIKNGDNSQRQQAYQLQAILQSGSVKSEQSNNSKLPLIIGGVVVVGLAVVVGYLWGKRRKEKEVWE
jgi:hypothetical protein